MFAGQKRLMVGISSRALFDLEEANRIYEQEGLEAYCQYQLANENKVLKPGAGFGLVQSLLALDALLHPENKDLANEKSKVWGIEVVIISRNSADTSLRIANSIRHYGFNISRAAFTSGAPVTPYLNAFGIDLFLSAHESDVQQAIEAGFAAGLIYTQSKTPSPNPQLRQIRLAFDGDAVLFSEESELIFQRYGLEAFLQHEEKLAEVPLAEGPFANLLKTISHLQFALDYQKLGLKEPPIRLALVTARNSPAQERVIRTLRAWKVRIDETFFLGGLPKDQILAAFAPDIFFEDQPAHCERAAKVVPTARVPHRRQPPKDPAAPIETPKADDR
jgi:5'-nucleotidase